MNISTAFLKICPILQVLSVYSYKEIRTHGCQNVSCHHQILENPHVTSLILILCGRHIVSLFFNLL